MFSFVGDLDKIKTDVQVLVSNKKQYPWSDTKLKHFSQWGDKKFKVFGHVVTKSS